MASEAPEARYGSLFVEEDGNSSFNGTINKNGGTNFSNPRANTTSGIYNSTQLVKLMVNGSETIYYTTKAKLQTTKAKNTPNQSL